jgi:predicted DCC family thiol-disulfide oxidoreductase YuxK
MQKALTVYFDGGCPLCRREIAFWQRRRGADAIDWIDLTALPGDHVRADLTKEDAVRRFHVARPDGRLLSGARAFAAMWSVLPATRIAGRAMALPGIVQVLDAAYALMLKVRPLWRPVRCTDDVCDLR